MTTVTGVPFGTRLRELAGERAESVALVLVPRAGDDIVLTYAQLERETSRWCRALQASGVVVGDRVALAVANGVELVVSALATWKAGGVPVPVRWDLPDWERERVLDVIDAKVVVDDHNLEVLAKLAAGESDAPVPDVVSPQLNGICSSGSTGTPKVIMTERPALWSPAMSQPFITAWTEVARPQTILVPGPMYHANGFANFPYLLAGDRLVVLEKFDAATVLDVIEKHRITTFTATPTMLQRIAAVPGIRERDLSSIAWILQGAAMMPPALLRTWFDVLGPEKVVMSYGMTEQLGLAALRGDEWLEHPGSVGRGFRGTEIRILDENGHDVPTGQLGDVYLRWSATGSYAYRGSAATLPTTPDGFATAGDIGRLDEDGYLYLADRRVDMIITGGANVFPAEVETALSEHPAIADVVVIGLQDAEWGRRVHAIVQARGPLTEQDVIAFAKSRLSPYKVPKSVEFVDEIPRAASTKVNRGALRDARGG